MIAFVVSSSQDETRETLARRKQTTPPIFPGPKNCCSCSFMSSSSSVPPQPPSSEEDGTTPQRKRTRESEPPSTPNRFELVVVEEDQTIPVPDHLAALPFLLDQGSACRLKKSPSQAGEVPCPGPKPGKYTIVVGVNGDVTSRSQTREQDPDFEKQSYICRALGVCPHRIYHSLLRGYLPDDMIVYKRPADGMDMLLWCATSKAVDRIATLVVIDVTDWLILPGLLMRDCRCVLEEEKNRYARQSLHSLSNLIEENSDKLCEQDYIHACGHMKRIFKSISA